MIFIFLKIYPTLKYKVNYSRAGYSDKLIMKQADLIAELGLDKCGYRYVNIDDGYFGGRDENGRLVADPVKFPNGLNGIVEKIHEKGMLAGMWLAPFVAETKSRLFNEKRDWFKKDEKGEPLSSGGKWSGFYALDLENHEVRDYIAKCLRHYADMGFDFFKLDFLYAASLPDYEGKTRSEAAEFGYDFLREVLKDKLILGCGATLINSAGKFDYLRVGPDVSLEFDDKWYMRRMHRERVSTKVTVQNTVYRSFMDGRLFGCDPDVFLLRDYNISLTPEQRRALITLDALFGSLLMTSDNVATYDEKTKELLSSSLELFENARVTAFSRFDDVITVTYELAGKTKTIKYNTEKGVLI